MGQSWPVCFAEYADNANNRDIYVVFFLKSDGKTNNSRMSGAFIQSGAESIYNDVVKESTVSQVFAILARPQWGKFAALSVWSKPFYSETHNYKVRCSSILVRRHWTACTETVLALAPWQHNMWTQPSAPQLFILTNSLFFPPSFWHQAAVLKWNQHVEGSAKPNVERTLQIDEPNSGGRQACRVCVI